LIYHRRRRRGRRAALTVRGCGNELGMRRNTGPPPCNGRRGSGLLRGRSW
jgi:hypothetical protein